MNRRSFLKVFSIMAGIGLIPRKAEAESLSNWQPLPVSVPRRKGVEFPVKTSTGHVLVDEYLYGTDTKRGFDAREAFDNQYWTGDKSVCHEVWLEDGKTHSRPITQEEFNKAYDPIPAQKRGKARVQPRWPIRWEP